DKLVTGVQTCALPIYPRRAARPPDLRRGPRRGRPPRSRRAISRGGAGGGGRLLRHARVQLVDPRRSEERDRLALAPVARGERPRSEERRVGKEGRARW